MSAGVHDEPVVRPLQDVPRQIGASRASLQRPEARAGLDIVRLLGVADTEALAPHDPRGAV